MQKFCPNCGSKVKAGARFCPTCGKDLSKSQNIDTTQQVQPIPVQPQQVSTPEPVQQSATPQRSTSSPAKKRSHKRGIIITIVSLVVVALVAIGGIYIYDLHQDQQAAVAIDHMSNKKLAGMTLAYAHVHYPKNKSWAKAYDEAIKNGVNVSKHKSYEINGYTVKAARGNNIYVINDEVAFTMSDEHQHSKSTIELADGKKNLGTVKAMDAYKTVTKNQSSNAAMKKINQKSTVNVNDKQLAILVAFARDGVKEGTRTIEANSDNTDPDYYQNSKDGFHVLQLGGDGASQTLFKQNGQKVIAKFLDVKHAVDAASAPLKTVEYSLPELISEYYSTSEQKSKVNDLANELVVSDYYDDNNEDDSDEDTDEDSESEDKQSNENQDSKTSETKGKYSNLPPAIIPVAMRGTWYAAGLLHNKLNAKVHLGVSDIDGQKLYFINKAPNDTKDLQELNKEYKNDLIVQGEQPSGGSVSYTQGGGQTDGSGYQLTKLDGITCLMYVSQVPGAVYFRTPELAQKFTDKYKNDKKFFEKLMDLQK